MGSNEPFARGARDGHHDFNNDPAADDIAPWGNASPHR